MRPAKLMISSLLIATGLFFSTTDSLLSQTAKRLTMTMLGGATEKNFNEAVLDSFSRDNNVRIEGASLLSEEALARMIAEEKRPSIDLFQFTGGQELTAKARGLTQSVGELRDINLPPAFRDPDGQWVAFAAVPSGIVYNTKYIKTPPTSFQDFFKPEYKGRVGLANFSNVKGIDFMVMLARVFGGDESNVAPGMAKLKELVDNGAQFYSTAAQMRSLFAQEEVWIAYYDSANALSAKEQGMPVGFAVPQEGMSIQTYTAAIAKNSENGDVARDLIRTILLPDTQAKIAEKLGWSPVNPDTKIPESLKDKIISGEDQMKAFVILDREVINENKKEWIDQFNRMVAR